MHVNICVSVPVCVCVCACVCVCVCVCVGPISQGDYFLPEIVFLREMLCFSSYRLKTHYFSLFIQRRVFQSVDFSCNLDYFRLSNRVYCL